MLMPGMGGCEVCRQLKEKPRLEGHSRHFFFLRADDKDLIVRALDSGGVDYITKTVQPGRAGFPGCGRKLALKKQRGTSSSRSWRTRTKLLGILAHDLKNYLGGMNMSAGLPLPADRPFQ